MRVIRSSSIPHNEKHQIVKKSYKSIAPAPAPQHTQENSLDSRLFFKILWKQEQQLQIDRLLSPTHTSQDSCSKSFGSSSNYRLLDRLPHKQVKTFLLQIFARRRNSSSQEGSNHGRRRGGGNPKQKQEKVGDHSSIAAVPSWMRRHKLST